MRSTARCVLPVLVGPRTARTLLFEALLLDELEAARGVAPDVAGRRELELKP
jgi:hypothetical protein